MALDLGKILEVNMEVDKGTVTEENVEVTVKGGQREENFGTGDDRGRKTRDTQTRDRMESFEWMRMRRQGWRWKT